jgi:hypothetical protein
MSVRTAAFAAALLSVSSLAWAQIAPRPDPVHHGVMSIRRTQGEFDRTNGNTTIGVRGWRLALVSTSNGLYPDQEPILITLEGDGGFFLRAGMLERSRSGKTFSYRAEPNDLPRSILSFRLRQRPDGTYRIRFRLRGLNLSRLIGEDPVCLPMAVIIGDDDGFAGVEITRRSFRSRRVSITRDCTAELQNEWPWL